MSGDEQQQKLNVCSGFIHMVSVTRHCTSMSLLACDCCSHFCSSLSYISCILSPVLEGGLLQRQCHSSHEQSYSTLSPVSTGMGDRFWMDIPPWYVTKPTRSTQPCILPGLLNRVPTFIGLENQECQPQPGGKLNCMMPYDT